MKRFRYLLPILALFVAAPARAQIPTYTTPQADLEALATNTSCTGSAQTFTPKNLGQTQHYVSAVPAGGATFSVVINGIDQAGNTVRISDNAEVSPASSASIPNGVLAGFGSFAKIQVVVTCAAASGQFTLSYAGTSATQYSSVGSFAIASQVKEVFNGVSLSGSPTSQLIQTPYGSTLGAINVTTTAATNLVLSCPSPGIGFGYVTWTVSAPDTGGSALTTYPIPNYNCPFFTINASTASGTIYLEYIFQSPGQSSNATLGLYSHQTGTTSATSIKSGAGALIGLTVNTAPAAATLQIFDLASGSCTGTPSTNEIAGISAVAHAFPTATLSYNVAFQNGLCVLASSGTLDYTVSYQ